MDQSIEKIDDELNSFPLKELYVAELIIVEEMVLTLREESEGIEQKGELEFINELSVN